MIDPILIMGLSSIKGFGYKTIRRLTKKIKNIKQLEQNNELKYILKKEQIIAIQSVNWKKWEQEYITISKNCKITTYGDEAYPKELIHAHSPPLLLYYKGIPPLETEKAVAIVGTRKASSYGKRQAYLLARQLAEQGVTIVSGLAYGIDIAAHKAAIDCGGRTIAVLGSGFYHVYPRNHSDVALQIAEKGLCLSEYSPNTSPKPHHFPQRNRIVAGLSLGIIVVEAPSQSGALITAYNALEMGKEIFAIPGNIDNVNTHGCHKLIQQGAKLIHSIDDIWEELPQLKKEHIPKVFEMSDIQQKIWAVLSEIPQTTEDIINQVKLPASTVASELTVMMIDELIFCANNRYCRNGNWR